MSNWIDSLPDNPDSIANVLPSRGVKFGGEYIHRRWGRVLVIAPHPHDGACLIVERMVDTHPHCDERAFDSCTRSDLVDAVGEQWPFLGFTV